MLRRAGRLLSILCIMAVMVSAFSFTVINNPVFAEETSGEIKVFNPVADAHVRSGGYKGSNFGSSAVMEVKEEESTDGNRRAFFKFDFSEAAGSIERATLRLYAATIGFDAQRKVVLYGTDEAWQENLIKWENAPSVAESVYLAEFTVLNPTVGCPHSGVYRDHEHPEVEAQWFEVDVTDYVRSQSSDKTVSFMAVIGAKSFGSNVNFASREAAAGKRPELVIETAAADPEPDPYVPVIYNPLEDTFVKGGNNTGHFDTLTSLEVRDHYELANLRRSYIKFDFSDFDMNLESATLRLYATLIGATATRNITIGGVTNAWDASVVTWSGTGTAAPSAKNASVFIANLTIDNPTTTTPKTEWTGGQWYEIDVTDYLKSHINDGAVSFVLWLNEDKSSNNQVHFNSSEAETGKPELILTPGSDEVEQVADVTASPAPGLLAGPTDVALSTATVGAAVYYRIDDDTTWNEYTAPIHVTKYTKITAVAKKPPLMLDSNESEFIYRFPVDTDINIIRAESPILLDGTVETDSEGNPAGEWEGAELIRLEGIEDATGRHGADVYMKYDYEMLYIGARIKDPSPMVNTKTGSGIWNGDCLEIFMGDEDLDFSQFPTGSMAPSDRQIVLSGGKSNGYQYYLYVNGLISYPVMLMHLEPDLDGMGYTMEAAIPLVTLGLDKSWRDGRDIIMNVVISNGGYAGRGHWGWTTNGEQTKKSRGLWGKAAFELAPDPEEEIAAVVEVDNVNRNVTVTGQTLNVHSKFVTMLVTDPSGEVSTFEQVMSDEDGGFTFNFNLNCGEEGNGTYKVLIGGEEISVAMETSFIYTCGEDEPELEQQEFTVGQLQFTDIHGETVTALTGSGFIKASAAITSNKGQTARISMIAALFNENNTISRIGTVEREMAPGETAVFKAGFDLPENVAGNKIKVFVWDSLEGMNPMSDVVVFPN